MSASTSSSLTSSCGIVASPVDSGEMNALGSLIDWAMYSSAVMPGRRLPAQTDASTRRGYPVLDVVESGPRWHDEQPLARNSWAPSGCAVGWPAWPSLFHVTAVRT